MQRPTTVPHHDPIRNNPADSWARFPPTGFSLFIQWTKKKKNKNRRRRAWGIPGKTTKAQISTEKCFSQAWGTWPRPGCLRWVFHFFPGLWKQASVLVVRLSPWFPTQGWGFPWALSRQFLGWCASFRHLIGCRHQKSLPTRLGGGSGSVRWRWCSEAHGTGHGGCIGIDPGMDCCRHQKSLPTRLGGRLWIGSLALVLRSP